MSVAVETAKRTVGRALVRSCVRIAFGLSFSLAERWMRNDTQHPSDLSTSTIDGDLASTEAGRL